jgi:hypothetical protein
MASLASDQSIMRKIQSRALSRAIILLGIRWSSSLHRAQVGPIVQNIVVESGLGGITSAKQYSQQKMASVKGNFHFLQQIQQTQNKTQHQHRNMIQELIIPLFEETNDPMVDYIKQSLFKVDKPAPKHFCRPIVSPDHDFIQEMMHLPAPVVNGEHLALPPSS